MGAWYFGCLSGPPGFACWVYFTPVFGFVCCWVPIFALSPCCFLVCVFLGMVGWGSFVRAGCLCVLVRVWVGGGVGAVGPVWALGWDISLTVPGWCFFVGLFCFFRLLFVRVCLCVPCGRLLGDWPLGFSLWCPTVSLSVSHWYPGSGVVLDCIDS